MKFSVKVFLSTITIVVLSFSLGGYFLVSALFDSALEREVAVSTDENRMLRISFEAALSGAPLEDGLVGILSELSESIVTSASAAGATTVRIYDAERNMLYETGARAFDSPLLYEIDAGTRGYLIHRDGDSCYIQTACMMYSGDIPFYLESIRDIGGIFSQREEQFRILRLVALVMTFVSGVVVYGISLLLTRPLRRLSQITRRIAGGDISQRADIGGRDEFGQLASDFNDMAAEVERRIDELEEANRRQEDFIASFAHELKTPLTSMIGYADMLRSRRLEPEEQFTALNYIFSEGKRLEALSLKLLDLIVLKKSDFEMKPVRASLLLDSVQGFLMPALKDRDLRLQVSCEDAVLLVEADLFHTLLINLVDNARKAVGNSGQISLIGKREGGLYAIYVCDNGKGMDPRDLPKITEAFYRVDKSRARSQGGAGLGLAICAEIVKLHGGALHFKSMPGKGTIVRVILGEVANEA